MSSCCGGNCGCGAACKCGGGCSGCGMHADLGYSEKTTTAATIVAGVPPVKMYSEGSEMSFEGEGGCKCGNGCGCGGNCKCSPCNC